MALPQHADSVVVDCSADELYDMVADITRMGEWSPVCKECWWVDGGSPVVGAWFTGRNEQPDKTWKTRSQVAVADRGREFTFIVGGAHVRWGYTFAPVSGGTLVTESWEMLPAGMELFQERFGAAADATIAERAESARSGIPVTLAAIKAAAEAG